MSTTAQQVRHAGHRAARGDWVEWAGRIGLVAKGVSYALIGILAIQIPLGQGGQAADRQGVLRELANDFHTYYNAHTFLVTDAALRDARLNLIAATRRVIANGLALLAVSAPPSM